MIERLVRAARSVLAPAAWLHLVHLVHHWYATHVVPRRSMTLGRDVRISPTASFTNGERIVVGDETRIGEYSSLWAGNRSGRITVGARTTFGPGVYVTASNYGLEPGVPPMLQDTVEQDVRIGEGCWLGTRVVVLPGVTIGDGCVVAAGAVVTKDLPPNTIAAGVPATVVRER